jgi:hypothetical protein
MSNKNGNLFSHFADIEEEWERKDEEKAAQAIKNEKRKMYDDFNIQ